MSCDTVIAPIPVGGASKVRMLSARAEALLRTRTRWRASARPDAVRGQLIGNGMIQLFGVLTYPEPRKIPLPAEDIFLREPHNGWHKLIAGATHTDEVSGIRKWYANQSDGFEGLSEQPPVLWTPTCVP